MKRRRTPRSRLESAWTRAVARASDALRVTSRPFFERDASRPRGVRAPWGDAGTSDDAAAPAFEDVAFERGSSVRKTARSARLGVTPGDDVERVRRITQGDDALRVRASARLPLERRERLASNDVPARRRFDRRRVTDLTPEVVDRRFATPWEPSASDLTRLPFERRRVGTSESRDVSLRSRLASSCEPSRSVAARLTKRLRGADLTPRDVDSRLRLDRRFAASLEPSASDLTRLPFERRRFAGSEPNDRAFRSQTASPYVDRLRTPTSYGDRLQSPSLRSSALRLDCRKAARFDRRNLGRFDDGQAARLDRRNLGRFDDGQAARFDRRNLGRFDDGQAARLDRRNLGRFDDGQAARLNARNWSPFERRQTAAPPLEGSIRTPLAARFNAVRRAKLERADPTRDYWTSGRFVERPLDGFDAPANDRTGTRGNASSARTNVLTERDLRELPLDVVRGAFASDFGGFDASRPTSRRANWRGVRRSAFARLDSGARDAASASGAFSGASAERSRVELAAIERLLKESRDALVAISRALARDWTLESER